MKKYSQIDTRESSDPEVVQTIEEIVAERGYDAHDRDQLYRLCRDLRMIAPDARESFRRDLKQALVREAASHHQQQRRRFTMFSISRVLSTLAGGITRVRFTNAVLVVSLLVVLAVGGVPIWLSVRQPATDASLSGALASPAVWPPDGTGLHASPPVSPMPDASPPVSPMPDASLPASPIREGSPPASAGPHACYINLVDDYVHCPSEAVSILSLADHRVLLRLTLHPSQYQRAQFEVRYGAEPTEWTVNIGDSVSNNGGGGDAYEQTYDAELQVYHRQFLVRGNDTTPLEERSLVMIEDFASAGSTVSFTVANHHLDWRSGDAVSGSLDSAYLYALSGQHDEEQAGTNYDLYAAFNRVIGGTYRVGSGVSEVYIILE